MAAMLVLPGCHRHAVADVTLDADQDARNATEAKIDADLAAADAAARAPMPRARPESASLKEHAGNSAELAPVEDTGDASASEARENDNDVE